MPFFAQQATFEEIEQGRIGRVIEVQRSVITVTDGSQERSIPMTSSWQKAAPEDRPTVGDWVVLEPAEPVVRRRLDRQSLFQRRAAGIVVLPIPGLVARHDGVLDRIEGHHRVVRRPGHGDQAAGGERLQQAWIAEEVPQCGYCQSGQLLTAAALLARRPQPSATEIDAALSGVLCRCGTYNRIRRAIQRAATDTKEA